MKDNRVISPRMRASSDGLPSAGSYNMVSGVGYGSGKYAKSAWAYACMKIRSRELATMPWRLMKHGKPVKEHPIIDMLTEFGQESNWPDAFAATEIDMLSKGCAFWLKDGDIVERLNAGTMKVEANKSGIQRFIQRIEGKIVHKFKREEIVYFREYHPETDLLPGTAVMDVLKLPLSQEWEAAKYVEAFFMNDATPATLLSTEQTVSEQEMSKVLEWWRKRFRGTKNKGKVGFADRGMKANVLSSSLKDMVLIELRNQSREDICTAFEVPKILLSMEDATFANAQEARKYMIEDLVVPRSNYYAAAINKQLVQPIDPMLTFEFYPDELPILQENLTSRWERLKEAIEAQVITEDYARERMGWPAEAKPEEKVQELESVEPDMKAWKRKATKAFKRGESADVEFETDRIPGSVQMRIHDRLAQVQSQGEILRAFIDD